MPDMRREAQAIPHGREPPAAPAGAARHRERGDRASERPPHERAPAQREGRPRGGPPRDGEEGGDAGGLRGRPGPREQERRGGGNADDPVRGPAEPAAGGEARDGGGAGGRRGPERL